MKKRFILLGLLLPFLANTAHAHSVKAIASVFAPLQMTENEEVTGYAVETVKEVLSRLQAEKSVTDYELKLYPWKRAFHMAQHIPNVMFFSISRTSEREDKFHWVGEISPYDVYFFKLKTNNKVSVIDSLDQIKAQNYKLGVQVSSNAEKLLLNNGYVKKENFITYSHYTTGIPMLFRGRFDMLPLTKAVARTNTCKLGLNGDQIEPVYRINELSKPLWLVYSKDTPVELVEKTRIALDQLKKEGFLSRVQEEYLTRWQNQPCVKK